MNARALFRWLLPAAAVAQAAASSLMVRNLPGRTAPETINEVKHILLRAASDDGVTVLFDNTTLLDTSMKDQTLFTVEAGTEQKAGEGEVETTGSISVICTDCYLKGSANAKMTITKSYNMTKAVASARDDFVHVLDKMVSYGEKVIKNISTTDLDHISIPPPDIDFDVKVDGLPEAQLELTFNNVDLYVALDTVLSTGVTYTLPLYTSNQLGVQLEEDLFVGAIFSVDIVLSVESAIDMKSGFHIKFDDDVKMKIALFANEASSLSFNGGKFEFLPVEIATSGVVFTAALRLQLRSGFSFPDSFSYQLGDLSVGAGVEARVYANVAQFTTNVTTNLKGRDSNGKDCALNVAQDYQFAVGAAAGASLVILQQTLGPTPETEIPIFSTALASSCLASKKPKRQPTTTAKASLEARADSETLTHETEETLSVKACKSIGQLNCPASLQGLSRQVISTTLTSVVPSGASVNWDSTQAAGPQVLASSFPISALVIGTSSGKPKSYVPPPTGTGSFGSGGGSAESVIDGETGGVSNKVIIGVSVGIGVPVVVAVVTGACLLWRRKRYSAVPTKPREDEARSISTVMN